MAEPAADEQDECGEQSEDALQRRRWRLDHEMDVSGSDGEPDDLELRDLRSSAASDPQTRLSPFSGESLVAPGFRLQAAGRRAEVWSNSLALVLHLYLKSGA